MTGTVFWRAIFALVSVGAMASVVVLIEGPFVDVDSPAAVFTLALLRAGPAVAYWLFVRRLSCRSP